MVNVRERVMELAQNRFFPELQHKHTHERFIEILPDGLRAGQNLEIRVGPDGAVHSETVNLESESLLRPDRLSGQIHSWRYEAAGQLLKMMERADREMRPPGPSQPDRDDWEEYRKASNRMAVDLTACWAGGYIRAPGRFQAWTLHRLIGRDLVHRTLRIAGRDATLAEHNLVMRNAGALESDHALNPNAVRLWFGIKRSRNLTFETSSTGEYDVTVPTGSELRESLPERLSPGEAITQARNEFLEKLQRAYRNRPPDGAASLAISPERAWEIFSEINPRAFDRVAPQTKSALALVLAVHRAGMQPGCTVATAVMREKSHNILWKPSPLDTAVIRESRRPRVKQRRLASEYRALSRMTWRIDDIFGRDGEPAWADVREALSDTLEQQGLRDNLRRPRRRRRGHEPPVKKRSGSRTTDAGDLKDILSTPAGAAMAERAGNALRLAEEPGQRLALFHGEETLLDLEREPTGGVRVNENRLWTPNTPIRSMPARVEAAWVQAAVTELHREFFTHWDELAPRDAANPPTMNQVRRVVAGSGEEEFGRRFREALGGLLDQDIMQRAQAKLPAGRKTASLGHYNLAAMDPGLMRELERTNPGAAAWATNRLRPEQGVNHPGQLVSLVRESMRDMELTPAAWKMAAALPPGKMSEVCSFMDDEAAGVYFRLAAQAGHAPDPERFHLLLDDGRRPEPGSLRERAVVMALRADAEDPELVWPHARDVMDYVRFMDRQGEETLARSWRRLCRESDRWHRVNRDSNGWIRTLAEQGGMQTRWNSALPETFHHGEYSVVALDRQELLYLESRVMGHCVWSYGEKCAGGTSRIFSIREQGRVRATLEIVRRTPDSPWSVAQCRNRFNDRVTEQLERAAEAVAQRYDQAFREGFTHRSWREPATMESWEELVRGAGVAVSG